MIVGIILAAGYSKRMGAFKPLLKLGDHSVVIKQIKTLQSSDVQKIFVITGHRAKDLEEEIKTNFSSSDAVETIYNAHYDEGMFSSVLTGFSKVKQYLDDANIKEGQLLLLPVDCPLIPPVVIMELAKKATLHPNNILLPNFQGEDGHPPLIPFSYIDEILCYHGESGLKGFFDLKKENCVLSTPVVWPEILWDMDTPIAYENIQKWHQTRQHLNEKQCLHLLEIHRTPQNIILHSIQVARTAISIAKEMNLYCHFIDISLLYGASMLHDILKTEKNHDVAGATLLKYYGYDDIAEITKCHMDLSDSFCIEICKSKTITEKEILYLADKLTKGNHTVCLSERKSEMMKDYANDPIALSRIEKRMTDAKVIQDMIESIVGKELGEIL